MANIVASNVVGSPATVFNTGNLTTTVVQFSAPTSGFVRLARITNKATAAFVAWLPLTAAASVGFVASGHGVVAATEGIPLLPLGTVEVNLSSAVNLFVVASAGSTPVQVALFDRPVR